MTILLLGTLISKSWVLHSISWWHEVHSSLNSSAIYIQVKKASRWRDEVEGRGNETISLEFWPSGSLQFTGGTPRAFI